MSENLVDSLSMLHIGNDPCNPWRIETFQPKFGCRGGELIFLPLNVWKISGTALYVRLTISHPFVTESTKPYCDANQDILNHANLPSERNSPPRTESVQEYLARVAAEGTWSDQNFMI